MLKKPLLLSPLETAAVIPIIHDLGDIAVEQGRYSPSLEMAFQIARVFRVPLNEVFEYDDD